MHAGIQLGWQRGLLGDLDGGCHLLGAGLGDVIFTQVRVLVHVQLSVGGIVDGKTGVGAGQAMLMDVQAVQFLFFRNAQADRLFDDGKDDGHRDQNPGRHADNTQQLDAQLGKTAAVEQAAIGGKQTDRQCAPQAVHAVDRHRTDRVVDLGNVIEKFHREDAEHASHDADHGRAEGVDHITAGGDGHQTGQRTVEGKGDIGLAVAHPADDQRGHRSQSRRQVGVEADEARGNHRVIAGHADGRAAVKAEPAEPQDENTQGHGGQVVAGDSPCLAVLAIFADAGTEHPGTQAGGNTAHKVDRRGTGEIMEAQLSQPAAAPDPVAGNGIDDQADGGGVAAVGAELGALSHRAGNDGSCCGAEHGLEHRIDPDRQGSEIVAALDERVKPADQRAGAGKHDAETHQPVAGRADTEVHHILHQNIAGVLGTSKARLAQSKACLHKEHQERRNQCPGNVRRVVHNRFPSLTLHSAASHNAALHFATNNKRRRAGACYPVRRLCRLLCCRYDSTVCARGQGGIATVCCILSVLACSCKKFR